MAVPLIVMAIGEAAKAYAQNKAEQQNIAADEQGLQDMSMYQGKIDSALNGMVSKFANSRPEQYAAKQRGDYIKALNSAMPGSNEDIKGGSGYTTGRAQEAIGQHHAAINLADMLAKVVGPAEQRRMQGYQIANTGSDVARLANFARGTYGADTGGTIQPNNGLIFLGNLAEAYGMNKLGKPDTTDPSTAGGTN